MNIKRFLALVLIALLGISYFPSYAEATDSPPTLVSESAVLIDADTGQVLYSKDMDKKQFPASITKIITVALGLENAELDDKIVMSETAVDSVGRDTSNIALNYGEEITVEQAAYAAMLMSANDACNGIAELVSGSIEDFAKLMTEKAAEWGAKNTNFNNANGLKDDLHYTTAYDMAMIMRHALTIDKFREIIGTKTYEMPPNNKQKEARPFANQHSMLIDPKFQYEGIIGGKAGYTTVAQYTLVTAAERNGVRLIAVVMKSPILNDKYYDTIALLDYGFNNFSKFEISASELREKKTELTDEFGRTKTFDLEMDNNVSFLLHNSVDIADVTRSVVASGDFNGDYNVSLKLTLPETTTAMHPEIGLFDYPLTEQASATGDADVSEPGEKKTSWFITVLKTLGIILLVLIGAVILFVIAICIRNQIYYSRRRKKRRSEYERKYNRNK